MTEKSEPARRFYRRDAAALYLRERWGLRCSTKTLAKWACQGGGPRMSYSGRFPVYDEADLDAWAFNRMRGPFCSTAEAMAAEGEGEPLSRKSASRDDAASRGSGRRIPKIAK